MNSFWCCSLFLSFQNSTHYKSFSEQCKIQINTVIKIPCWFFLYIFTKEVFWNILTLLWPLYSQLNDINLQSKLHFPTSINDSSHSFSSQTWRIVMMMQKTRWQPRNIKNKHSEHVYIVDAYQKFKSVIMSLKSKQMSIWHGRKETAKQ